MITLIALIAFKLPVVGYWELRTGNRELVSMIPFGPPWRTLKR
jgi:hypothetical protein